MKLKSLFCLLAVAMMSCNVMAVFSVEPDYVSETVYIGNVAWVTLGGLDIDAGSLYAGQGSELVTVDLSDNSSKVSGSLPGAIANSLVVRYNGTTYTSYATTFSFPFPYTMGYVDSSGVYQEQLVENGIYDMAINSAGDVYFVADPTGFGQSQIFKYDLATGIATLAASVGGYAGGIAFDSADNLYYAKQNGEGILKFSADSSGVLDMSSSTSVLGITAGYIGFDNDDNFYATTGWGATFSQYDLDLGTLVADIAFGGIGQFVIDGKSIYLLDTDWSTYTSTIYKVTTIAAPITVSVDIMPGSGINPIRVNLKGQGVITVAILGSEEFDPGEIDVLTVALAGVSPIRSNFDDVSSPDPDGFVDLVLQFKRSDLLAVLENELGDLSEIEHGTKVEMTITGMLMDEDVEIEGSDSVRILNKRRGVSGHGDNNKSGPGFRPGPDLF